jgi:glycosyltransferase involved in cell wall biosynthesis
LILYGSGQRVPRAVESLRLLHVTPYYEDAWAYGGIPRLASALARGLAARGHAVTVCTTDACDDRRRLPPPARPDGRGATAGVDVRVFPNLSNALAYHLQAFCPVGLWSFLRHHARAFDVAHIHAHRHLPGVLAARALARAGVPYVVAPNGTAPRIERRRRLKQLFDATLGRRVLAGAARLIAVSEAERRDLVALGLPADRIECIPNPIDLDEFAPPPAPGRFRARLRLDTAPLVLFLGKLTPRKRLDVVVEAFARLDDPDARLAIAGNDMGAGRAVRRRLRARGLEPRVHLVGLLTGRARLEALADADVLVYPSEHEVFGLAAFEALLCGTPVVVADDSGCGEWVARLGGGLLARCGDAAATAAAIARVLADRASWKRAARAARARVVAAFAAPVVSERLEHLYAAIASRAGRGDRPQHAHA